MKAITYGFNFAFWTKAYLLVWRSQNSVTLQKFFILSLLNQGIDPRKSEYAPLRYLSTFSQPEGSRVIANSLFFAS